MFFGLFIGALLLVGLVYVQLDTFGGRYTRKVKEKLKKSKHFSKGQFQNLEHTPNFAEGVNVWTVFKKQFQRKNKNLRPQKAVPAKGINWSQVPNNSVLWLGHSSLFLKIQGISILVDPVRTVYASPLKGVNKSFPIVPALDFKTLENLDYILITHDHYDHLDRQTIKQLKHLQATFICGLGVNIHLQRWGIPTSKIKELEWWDTFNLNKAVKLHFLPTRHFSGRKWYRNNTLWGSFMLETLKKTIYLGGDSGYGTHFKTIARKFPKIDVAFLELGQYNAMWPYIHMQPEDFEKAVKDLKVRKVIPIHHSAFALSTHAWNEPHQKIIKLSEHWEQEKLYIPQIGEPIDFDESIPPQNYWWENI